MLKANVLFSRLSIMAFMVGCLLASLSFSACRKLKTPEAVAERENWYESFNDSVSYYENRSSEIDGELQNLNEKVTHLLQNFEKVKKPREVSGYYILKGWGDKLPMKSTGIYARINENESLELIATLSGSTFNRIEIVGLSSDMVKHDQALNYRHDSFNTVFFSGEKANAIAEYISQHSGSPLNLIFMEGGTKKSSFAIPASEKQMISQTWVLFSTQQEIRSLQKQLAICARKIDTFRRLKDDRHTPSPPSP